MKKIIVLALVLFSVASFSADKKSIAPMKGAYPEFDDVRCEKLSGHSLAEFKAKLVDSCDLNKPYSSSLSRILNEDTYFYCCQIRK